MGSLPEEIQSALAQSMADGFKPTLAIVFLSIKHDRDAVVMFSRTGMLLSLGPLMNQEIEAEKNVWNVPMTGIFSNAELAKATEGNLEMHNLTTCRVALKEK